MMPNELNHETVSSAEVRSLIRGGAIRFAGNKRLKIYGKLDCSSGKRMIKINRVFFASEEQAMAAGYRACKKCMIR